MKSYEQDGYRRFDPPGQHGGRGLLAFVAFALLGLFVAMLMLGGLLVLKDEVLSNAARSGNVLMIRLALDAGAAVNAMNEPGLTPLGIAAKSDGAEVAVTLMDAGADINAPDAHGMTPLHHAAAFGNADMVDLLINAGADPSARDAQGYTPLLHAAASGYPWIVETLASHGADVNAADTAGDTALLIASGYGRLNVVERLLGLGADLNHQNAEGRTALHMALDEINPEVVAALIVAGAREDIPDGEGRTAKSMPGMESAVVAQQETAPFQAASRQTSAPRTPEVLGIGLEGMDDNAGGLVKAAFETRALKPTKGVVGNSLSMFGRADFTLVEPLDFSDGYAIAVWFWVSEQGGDVQTTWTPVLSTNLMQLDLYDRYLRAYFAGKGEWVSFLELAPPARGVEPNKWYHLSVAVDMDTSEAAVYLDGELLGMAPLEHGVRGDLKFIRLGSMAGQNTPATFSGGFDELKVYRLTGGIKQLRKLVPGPA